MNEQQQTWEIVLRMLKDGLEPSAEQLNSLSADERELLDALRLEQFGGETLAFLDSLEEDRDWELLREKVTPVRVIQPWRKVWRYAAAILLPLILAGGVYLFYPHAPKQVTLAEIPPTDHKQATLVLADGREISLNKHPDVKLQEAGAAIAGEDSTTLRYTTSGAQTAVFNKLIVPRGGEYKLVLADGTEIWVNAASAIRYPVHFDGADKRELFLEQGEIYLKVARNASQPFIVHTGKMDVQVLGTEFNINTYTRSIQTTLVEGKVQISVPGQSPLLLSPGQQALLDQGSLTKSDVDVLPVTAWKDGWMIFDNSTLEEVMTQLGRWYDYDVQFSDDQLKHTHFGGKLRKYKHIQEIFAAIEKTGPVQFRIEDGTIYVSGKKNN